MENKRVRSWEKCHLQWSGQSVFHRSSIPVPHKQAWFKLPDANDSVNIDKNVTETAPWLEE